MATEITPSTFENYLKEVTIPLKQPTMVWGQPGIGKTQIIEQVARDMGYISHVVYLPQMEPWELTGLPMPVDGKTVYYPPKQAYPDHEKVILFLDELAQCSREMQNMASRIANERILGDYKLPESWVVVLAGNRQEDKAGTTRVSSHINNRVAHLNLVVQADDWVRWALNNDIDMRAIKFIQMRGEMLNTFNPDERINATPRTWEKASHVISHTNNKMVLHPALVGLLGEEVGTAFYGFLDIFDKMVDINQIIMAPDRTEVPDDPSTLFAVSAALVSKSNEENIDRIFTYTNRMPEEFQVRTISDMATKHDWVTNQRCYTKWAIDHSDLYLAAA